MAKIDKDSIDALLGIESRVSKKRKLTDYEAVMAHEPVDLLNKFCAKFGQCRICIYENQTKMLFEVNGEYHWIRILQPDNYKPD